MAKEAYKEDDLQSQRPTQELFGKIAGIEPGAAWNNRCVAIEAYLTCAALRISCTGKSAPKLEYIGLPEMEFLGTQETVLHR